MWQQMTKKKLEQIEKQQQRANETKACSTYAEAFALPGFEVKELGIEIDEEVCVSKKILLPIQTAYRKNYKLIHCHISVRSKHS